MGCACNTEDHLEYEMILSYDNESIGKEYESTKILTEDDVRKIIKAMIYLEYNTRIRDKRSLQAKRAGELNNGLSKNYLQLLRETKEIDNEIKPIVEAKVLTDYKVNPEDFKTARESMNTENIVNEVMETLLKSIFNKKEALCISGCDVLDIEEKLQNQYDEANFKLNANPEISMEIESLYKDEVYITSTDILVADAMYKDYKLLPLELQAMIGH